MAKKQNGRQRPPRPAVVQSDGSRRLAKLVTSGGGIGRTEVAEALGVGWTTVHRWANGMRSPNAIYAGRMEAIYGIPARSWSEGIEDVAA